MNKQAEILKSLFNDENWLCGYCGKGCWGCDCKTMRKAKQLTDRHWEQIAEKFPFEKVDFIDVESIAKEISKKWDNINGGYGQVV